jgi:hypothetical protein
VQFGSSSINEEKSVMTRQTGIIITIASAVLCGCSGIFMCLFGALSAAGLGTYTSELGGTADASQIDPIVGVAILCFGIIFLAIPVASYFLLVHNKPANPPAAPPTM